jgi:hypothetical protein
MRYKRTPNFEPCGHAESEKTQKFVCQFRALRLKPWQTPPCVVADESEPRVGEEEAAKLLRRMLRASVSRWRPDPLAALEAVAD